MIEQRSSQSSEARPRAWIGLLINGCVFFVLSFLLWGVRYRSPEAAALFLVAPPYLGVQFLQRGDMDMTITSLAVTVGAVLLVSLAIVTSRSVLVVLAHIALVLYFLWSFCVLGIGV